MLEVYRTNAKIRAKCTIDYTNILYLFIKKMKEYRIEYVSCIFLDINYNLIEVAIISKGNIDAVPVDITTILKRSKYINATHILIAHNHPEDIGTCHSSVSDIKAHKFCKGFFSNKGIDFIDSFIIANENDNFCAYSITNNIKINYNENNYFKRYCDIILHKIRIKAIKNEGIYKAWNIYKRWEKGSEKPVAIKNNSMNIETIASRTYGQLIHAVNNNIFEKPYKGFMEIYRPSSKNIIEVNCLPEIYDTVKRCISFSDAHYIDKNKAIYAPNRSGYILLDFDFKVLEIIIDDYSDDIYLNNMLPEVIKRAKALRAKNVINFYERDVVNNNQEEFNNCYNKKLIFDENEINLKDVVIIGKNNMEVLSIFTNTKYNLKNNEILAILRKRNCKYDTLKSTNSNSLNNIWKISDRWERQSAKPIRFNDEAILNKTFAHRDMADYKSKQL